MNEEGLYAADILDGWHREDYGNSLYGTDGGDGYAIPPQNVSYASCHLSGFEKSVHYE